MNMMPISSAPKDLLIEEHNALVDNLRCHSISSGDPDIKKYKFLR